MLLGFRSLGIADESLGGGPQGRFTKLICMGKEEKGKGSLRRI